MDIQDILHAIDELDPSELQRVSQHIEQRQRNTVPIESHRTLNLHQGVIQTTDDFDDPLPDSFWLDQV